ncbi:MAG: hypothetical protein FWH27_10320, partial [Planctomycetaceae bacterium]|nr:hypothetical protein [Planctomycetaceae bacterium]
MGGQGHLFQIVGTLHSTSRFTGSLHSRQQKCDQNTYDRNDNKKFNQGEASQIAPPPPFLNLFFFSKKTFFSNFTNSKKKFFF